MTNELHDIAGIGLSPTAAAPLRKRMELDRLSRRFYKKLNALAMDGECAGGEWVGMGMNHDLIFGDTKNEVAARLRKDNPDDAPIAIDYLPRLDEWMPGGRWSMKRRDVIAMRNGARERELSGVKLPPADASILSELREYNRIANHLREKIEVESLDVKLSGKWVGMRSDHKMVVGDTQDEVWRQLEKDKPDGAIIVDEYLSLKDEVWFL